MEKGLTSKQAIEKIKVFGKNEITTRESFSAIALFISQFRSLINAILAIAAVFSFLIKDTLDGVFIVAILFLNSAFGFVQEYRAEKSLEKLKSFVAQLCRVIRDGKEIQIPVTELVPLDLVVLSEGDRIPADGEIVLSNHLEVDESILTGESLPVIKKQGDPLFLGTLITKGRARLLVRQTGMKTKFGQIAKTLSAIEADKTPLQVRLATLGKIISFGAVFISFLLIPIGIYKGEALFPLILLAVSVGVAAIPESLPAVVTIALAIGTNRMAKKKAIVRKMPAVETLGAIQVILTDKTGTLTQNVMRVKKFWTKNSESFPHLLQACVLGNTASLAQNEDKGEIEVIGDKTDGALLIFAKDKTKNTSEVSLDGKIIDEYVFDPQTKTITTVWEKNNNQYVFVRGAPEEVISKSSLTQKEKENTTKLFESYAKEGLRVIGFGYKTISKKKMSREELEKNLDFLGFVGIYDPPREEAKQAVIQAKEAGIQTIMVTGDNELTALSIAKDVGLVLENENVITGDELSKMSDQELEKIILKTRVFARAKPEDKLRLVELFKKLGFVVGVTGDGVNDALALKRADVGIAMGETGTDVAKEASDIVLTDDNFSNIVHAILEGRTIYNNILKAITYLLSGNLSEITLIFLAAVIGIPAPLLPTQILWINLVTDGLPALALASDNRDRQLLGLSPRDPKEPILTKNRILFITIVGFTLALVLLIIFSFLLKTSGQAQARTIIFNLLIFSHMLIAFIVRGKNIFTFNPFLLFSVAFIIFAQVVITNTPFFQKIFHLGF